MRSLVTKRLSKTNHSFGRHCICVSVTRAPRITSDSLALARGDDMLGRCAVTEGRQKTDRVTLALEQVKRTATDYAWSMFYAGIAVGFVLAWMLWSMSPDK